MAAVAGPLAAVSAVASVASGVMGGSATQAADEYQANKQRVAAEYAKTAATQTSAQMNENLNTQLENIDAVRVAGGNDPTSPTTVALRDRTAMMGDRARSIQVANIMEQSRQDEADAAYLDQAGSFAYTSGIIGGIASGAGKIAQTRFA